MRPAHATFAALWHGLPAGRLKRRAGAAMTLAGVVAGAVLLFVPVPSTVVVQGVVWPADRARVRTEVDGFVAEVLARDGQAVEPGTPLLVLAEPTLVAERDTLQARLLGLRARQYDAVLREPVQARNVLEELERTRAELDRAQQRIAQWTVRSKATGRLVLPRAGDLVGSFAPKGTTLAYVLEAAPALVRAVVPEEYAARLRARTPAVQVQLADRREEARARLVREVPAATHTLPSAALSAAYRVDPADKEGLRLLEPVFLFDVALEAPLPRLGARASVRFDLGSEPLALQWQRRVRQALLRHFNPVS